MPQRRLGNINVSKGAWKEAEGEKRRGQWQERESEGFEKEGAVRTVNCCLHDTVGPPGSCDPPLVEFGDAGPADRESVDTDG